MKGIKKILRSMSPKFSEDSMLKKHLSSKDNLILKLQEQINRLEAEIRSHKEFEDALNDRIVDLAEQLKAKEQQTATVRVLSNSELTYTRKKSLQETWKSKYESLLSEKQNLTMMLDSMDEEMQKLTKNMQEQSSTIATLNSKIQKLEHLLKTKSVECNLLKEKPNIEVQKDSADLYGTIQDLEQKLENAEKKGSEVANNNNMLSKINEDLRYKVERIQVSYQKLSRQVVKARRKSTNTIRDTLIMKRKLNDIAENNSSGVQESNTLLLVKSKLEGIYKKFLMEPQKTNDGNSSFYILTTPDFCNIEHEINRLLANLQEKIEAETSKENKFDCEGIHRKIRRQKTASTITIKSNGNVKIV